MTSPHSSETPPVSIQTYVHSVGSLPHGYQLIGVLLLGAALGAGAFALDALNLTEAAAVLLTAWAASFMQLTFRKGGEASLEGKHFSRVRSVLRDLMNDYTDWVTSRPILGKALVALGYATVFVVARAVLVRILTALSSPWLAAAIGLLFASIIASPLLWRALKGSLVGGGAK